MKNNNGSILYSWPVIIVALIVFWPVAIFLIYKRITIDKKAGFTISKVLRYVSYLCVLFVVAGISVSLDGGSFSENIGMILFYLVAGIVLFLFSRKLDTNAKRYKKYISIIINGNEVIIDNIASAMSLSTIQVRGDLDDMIQKGYFKDAYINESTNEIVLPQKSKRELNNTEATAIEENQSKIVSCKCCGAQNKVTRSVVECEYCGSPLIK